LTKIADIRRFDSLIKTHEPISKVLDLENLFSKIQPIL